MSLLSLHLTVSGRVQGVGFRYFTHDTARRLEINGYVKNLPNHGVEIYAEGSRKHIMKFLEQVKKGPSLSRVINTHAEWENITEKKYENFSINY